MNKTTQMIVRKKTQGQVSYNDGEFVEVEIGGIEGIEKGLFLHTVQFHRSDTSDAPDDFQNRFSVGTQLDIETATQISPVGQASEEP